jgi:hypothetical protein
MNSTNHGSELETAGCIDIDRTSLRPDDNFDFSRAIPADHSKSLQKDPHISWWNVGSSIFVGNFAEISYPAEVVRRILKGKFPTKFF